MAKDKMITSADELEVVMEQIDALKAQLEPLQAQEDAIRATLVKSLVAKGLQFVKTTSGLAFGLVKGRVSYKVREGKEPEAIAWAIKEFPGLLTIGAAKLNKVVQPMLTPPSFIERTEGVPHLSVRTSEEI